MNLQERDKKHLWHPLTQHQLKPDTLPIAKASGVWLYDTQGKKYLDGIASWYTCMFGHCNPEITAKVAAQMQKLDQVVFAGFTHEPAVKLSEALMRILPSNQQKIFFSDNGSTSVDVAIKMALQYYHNRGEKRQVLIAFEDGFHGDTFGAMSVSGLSVYNGPFEKFFLEVKRIPTPTSTNMEAVLQQLEFLLETNEVAAFVYEPLVQGAAAMRMYAPQALEAILQKCKSYEVLCIADEVMTGFGKTGKNFASDFVQTKPDIMCMSKALTAGLLPMALTSCSEEVYTAFLSDSIVKGFFHGHTYSANPLACTAALAGIELLQTQYIQQQIREIHQGHLAFAQKIGQHPKVACTRVMGVIFALDLQQEMSRYGNLRDKLFDYFMSQEVFLRPLGNTIYILAPYTIGKEEMQQIYNSIESALEIVLNH
ncbi:MAG: adenosylmethionine--8-amino-7-oxononanoate transaminase [Flavobacteriaceae bacterium]|nr:adenosylmethionine--8-amino-7-oxononanoate transaminase [Flavobacteriaceae bacterium]